ncbi:MAG: hypothetical protein HKP25_07550 [Marinicaulis sp.]|nr:hypothetical protein [Marinicaulis sp.]
MNNDLIDDLAYVKTLAEEGRDTPLVGGFMYVLWGSLFSVAAFIVYAHDLGWLGSAPSLGFAPWIAAFVIGWGASMFVGRRNGAKPGASTLGNKTANATWFAVGIFMTTFWFSLFFVHDNFTHMGVPPYFLFNLMFPIAFGIYAIAFFATATASRSGWLRWIGLAAILFSCLTLALMGSMHQILAGAIGTLICAVFPGVILMRQEPNQIV